MKLNIPDNFFSGEELLNTPLRWAKFMTEWLSHSNNFEFTTFENPGYNQMIIVKDITFYSICSHHLVPFFGKAHFAYIPIKRICGLSKIPRVIDKFAHKPQVQEKLTNEILNYFEEHLEPHWCMIILEAEHLCMSMRGIRKPGHTTITNAIRGESETAKREFLEMIRK
jgi:GTP cyclohydrolase I